MIFTFFPLCIFIFYETLFCLHTMYALHYLWHIIKNIKIKINCNILYIIRKNVIFDRYKNMDIYAYMYCVYMGV